MKTIEFKVEAQIATVSLNKPEVRNAFSPEMIQEITQIFSEVSTNEDLRAVVLRGNGPSFCAGADLNWMKSMASFTKEENIKDSEQLQKMFQTIYTCPVPVIGLVHGHAMGGGVGLVAVCDIAAAVRETKFAFSEVKLGLVPSVISPYVLRKMTRSSASELMLTGENFSADTAHGNRLLQFVGTAEEVEDYVLGKCDMLKAAGKQAVRDTKLLLREISGPVPENVSRLAVETIANRRVSAEGQEGLSAFFEKRRPSWRQ